jgi:hypothetical protein
MCMCLVLVLGGCSAGAAPRQVFIQEAYWPSFPANGTVLSLERLRWIVTAKADVAVC